MKTNHNNIFRSAKSVMIATVMLLAIPGLVQAQTIYKSWPATDMNIKVLGTSNVHDWTMTSTGIQSSGEFKFAGGNLSSLNGFALSVDVKSLKSENSSMDDRTYKAINADQYPNITYKLTSATVTTVGKNKYLIKTKGDLSIAGATQPIAMDVNAVVNADNSITCSGTDKLQLTDYKIKPPTFMLGTMKVYNDLTIQFNINYKK